MCVPTKKGQPAEGRKNLLQNIHYQTQRVYGGENSDLSPLSPAPTATWSGRVLRCVNDNGVFCKPQEKPKIKKF